MSKSRIPIRALVIDDDPAMCRKLRGLLEAESYEVVSFTDPQEGLDYSANVACDIALIDLRLPDCDGNEVIAKLRRKSPRTRVVGMSAFPQTEQVLAAVHAGARDVLPKPIEPAALFAALERQLAEIGIPVRTEKDYNRRLGARLRELRQSHQLAQQEVARGAGITAAQLSQIELGKTGTSAWTLARICGAIKTPLASLFEGF